MINIIETERLVLRPLTLEDADIAYYGWTREYHMIITIIWIVTIRLGETRERVLDSSCKAVSYTHLF